MLTTVPPGNVYVDPEHILADWFVLNTGFTVKVVVIMLSQPAAEVSVSVYVPVVLTSVPPGKI